MMNPNMQAFMQFMQNPAAFFSVERNADAASKCYEITAGYDPVYDEYRRHISAAVQQCGGSGKAVAV